MVRVKKQNLKQNKKMENWNLETNIKDFAETK